MPSRYGGRDGANLDLVGSGCVSCASLRAKATEDDRALSVELILSCLLLQIKRNRAYRHTIEAK